MSEPNSSILSFISKAWGSPVIMAIHSEPSKIFRGLVSALKIINPEGGFCIASLLASVNRGGRNPLSDEVKSSNAAASGSVVPIPTVSF
jgi:hypothetical protein